MTSQGENENAFVAGWSAAAAARLKVAIKRFGSQDKAASRAAISRQALVEILRFDEVQGHGSRPRYKTLYAICDAINADEDEILGEPERITLAHGAEGQIAGDADYRLIKRYAVEASAGPGRFPLSEEARDGIKFAHSWLIQRGIAADLSGLLTVAGDSMVPTIPHGATVLIQFAAEVTQEGIYVFNRAGSVCVKRIVPVGAPDEGLSRSLVITSDNPEYPPDVLSGPDLNELRIIGRVRSVMVDL